jgi:hypothetical protein
MTTRESGKFAGTASQRPLSTASPSIPPVESKLQPLACVLLLLELALRASSGPGLRRRLNPLLLTQHRAVGLLALVQLVLLEELLLQTLFRPLPIRCILREAQLALLKSQAQALARLFVAQPDLLCRGLGPSGQDHQRN